jgi:hypothetical protein
LYEHVDKLCQEIDSHVILDNITLDCVKWGHEGEN